MIVISSTATFDELNFPNYPREKQPDKPPPESDSVTGNVVPAAVVELTGGDVVHSTGDGVVGNVVPAVMLTT